MPSSFSANKNYELMADADFVGLWGQKTNANLNIIDNNFAGRAAITLTASNTTLTTLQIQNLIILLGGTPSPPPITVTFPAVGGMWAVNNGTNQSVILQSAGAGTSVPLPVGAVGLIYSDATNIKYASQPTFAQVGMIVSYGGFTTGPTSPFVAPSGWLACDGTSYLRTGVGAYPELYAVIGTTFGAVDGAHFSVPDLRGRFIAGYDYNNTMGRLTGAYAGGLSAARLGQAGGEQGHALTATEQASMSVGIPPLTVTGNIAVKNNAAGFGSGSIARSSVGSADGNYTNFSLSTVGASATAAGGNAGHNTIPPAIILNNIIFAGR